MKGTIFLKPLEFVIEATGEKWHQGDKLKGSLTIKNHSAEKIELPILKVALAEGNYKKIKARDLKGWTKLAEHILEEKISLGPNEEKGHSFDFKLPETSSITDKNGSLYLAFFDKEDPNPAGHIELVVEPKIVIQQILSIFENFMRFKVKEIKSGKRSLEVKLIPPTSRELSNLDGLVLNILEAEKTLTLNYNFSLRAIDLMSPTMQVEKKTKEIEQKFTAKEYMMYDSVNQDFIIKSLQTVIDSVKTKTL